MATTSSKVPTEHLQGVSETLLIPLYARACETQRADSLLHDPLAVQIVEQLDYDFARFGNELTGIAVRTRVMDDIVRDFLDRAPAGVVVNIGCGLDTLFYRVDNGQAHWYELDMPASIALWRQFFSEGERHHVLSCSALDSGWIDDLAPHIAGHEVLFLAAGVLMYFEEDQVQQLICTLAERFPGAEMVFDTVPAWFSQLSLAGRVRFRSQAGTYIFPPMPWGINYHQIPLLTRWHPAIELVRCHDYGASYWWRLGLYGFIGLLPFVRDLCQAAVVHLRFGQEAEESMQLDEADVAQVVREA
jgi:O-methyltransferase involved in polyketide biosynthesis